nr:hypothetical protein [Tanacetum cinerariifolium]
MDYEVAPQSGIPLRRDISVVLKIGPSGELDGMPTLSDGRDTTKTVETNLIYWAVTSLSGVEENSPKGHFLLRISLGDYAYTYLDGSMAWISKDLKTHRPFVLSWGGSISSDSFLPSILLLVVIIVTVVIVVVTVILVVVVVEIIGVVIVVVGGGDLVGLFYSNRLGICIPPGQGIIG